MNKNVEKKANTSVWQVARAVLSAFMGIRKKSDHENDAETLKPAQVIIGGLIGGALFVIGVFLLVKLVVS